MKKKSLNEVAIASALLGIIGVFLSVPAILVIERKVEIASIYVLYRISGPSFPSLGILAIFFGVISIDQFRINKGEKWGAGFAIFAVTTGMLLCALYIKLLFDFVTQS
jgi:hypothetical protein